MTSMRYSTCNIEFRNIIHYYLLTFNKVSRKLYINTNSLGNTTQSTKIQHIAQKYQYNVWVGLFSSM